MEKAQLERLNDSEKAKIAVAYLIKNKEEWPDGSERFFQKLEGYEKSASIIFGAMEEAKKSLMELQSKAEQLNGSIASVVELISEDLPKEKIHGWAEKFEIPKYNSDIPAKNNQDDQQDIDMAGSTAKSSEVAQMSSQNKMV